MRVPRLSDGVPVLDAFTLRDVSAQLAGEDEEHARRFGWFPARSTEQTVRAAIQGWQKRCDLAVVPGRSRQEMHAAENSSADARFDFASMESRRCPTGSSPPIAVVAWRAGLSASPATTPRGARRRRMELYIEPDNRASRGVARSAGFVEEGVLRSQGVTATGERRDMVLYSRLPSD